MYDKTIIIRFGFCDNPALDYSGYHKNLIQ